MRKAPRKKCLHSSTIGFRRQEPHAKKAIQQFFYLTQLENLYVAIEKDRESLSKYTVSKEVSSKLSMLLHQKIQPLFREIQAIFKMELPLPNLASQEIFDAPAFLHDLSATIQLALAERMDAILSSYDHWSQNTSSIFAQDGLMDATKHYSENLTFQKTSNTRDMLKISQINVIAQLKRSDDSAKASAIVKIFFELLRPHIPILHAGGANIRQKINHNILRKYMIICRTFQAEYYNLTAYMNFPQYYYWEKRYQAIDLTHELSQFDFSESVSVKSLNASPAQTFFGNHLVDRSRLTLPLPVLSKNSFEEVIRSDPSRHTIASLMK